ncbi:S8 family peptidase [Heyndrickxia sporothermodurans]
MSNEDDFLIKGENDKGKESENKSHFLIPDSEVKKVDYIPQARPKPKDIDHIEHGMELGKGIIQIKEKRKNKKTPISDDLVIFKVELSETDTVDARGDYEKIFLNNHLRVNAIKKSNVAIVSAEVKDFEKLENKLSKYINSSGKKSEFFQYINKISDVDNKDKKSYDLIYEDNKQDVNKDIQITLVPSLEEKVYSKMLGYLEGELEKSNGTLIDKPYFLSDNTPVLRVLLPSSGIDNLLDQEIVYKMEPTPFYTSGSNKKIEKLNVSSIELNYENENDDLPIVCILDDGIKFPDNLDECIAGYWVANDITSFSADHGTKVASRAIFGDNIDKNVLTDKRLTPKVKVIDAVISDGINSIPEPVLINRIKEAVLAIKDTTKIFNLSFNSRRPIKDDEISNLAYELDVLMKKYGVIFVVPTGNHNLWHTYDDLSLIVDDEDSRISAPGESVIGLTVGSITRENHIKSMSESHELSPFSRVGLGFCGISKPDLSYPGGNVFIENGQRYIAGNSAAYVINNNGCLETEFGTSFAAPLAAADLALLTKLIPDQNPFIAKSLLIHHSLQSAPMFNMYVNNQEDVCDKMHGKGIGDFHNACYSLKNRATYIRSGKLSRLVKQRVQFYMPSSLSQYSKKGSSVANVKVTCISIPPVSKIRGYEYLRAFVDTSLHAINSNGKEETRNPKGGKGRQKWHNIHHFSQTFTTFNPGDWQIWLRLYTKPEIEDTEEVDYILIVTIEDLTSNIADVHGGIEVEAVGRFHLLDEVEVEVGIDEVG